MSQNFIQRVASENRPLHALMQGEGITLQWSALGEKRSDSRADWCARELSSRQTVRMFQIFILSSTSENRPLLARMQGAGLNYTALVSARRKTPGLACGLVLLKAGSKADSFHVSEFHSGRC